MKFETITAVERTMNRFIGKHSYNTLQPHRMAGTSTPMYVVVHNRRCKMMPHVFQWQVPNPQKHCFFTWEEAVNASREYNEQFQDSPTDPVFVPMEWQNAIQLFPTHVRESLVSLLTLHLTVNT